MFETFSGEARSVVVRSQQTAREWRDAQITPLHLLAALAQSAHTHSGQLLASHDLHASRLAEEQAKANRRGGISDEDTAALRSLGIDVDAVVRSVESTHGENALRQGRRRGRRGLFGGERGHIPFTAEAKRVLERSLREAIELGNKQIGDEHILLALLGLPGLCAETLHNHGLDYTAQRRALAARHAS